MDKRYQVFVSSTYEDLQDERKEVMQALLELECIPAGMELFPASNDDQWSLIKRVIDDSDYYIVIIGGRYGSVNKDGISYTEMEYRYALDSNKPIIAFLHKDPKEIKSKFTETTVEGKAKLEAFRDLARNKMVKTWSNPDDLGSVVSRSMVNLIKQWPAVGWVKANKLANEQSLTEIIDLKNQIENLKSQLEIMKVTEKMQTLSQGEDRITIEICYFQYDNYYENQIEQEITLSWNEIFSVLAPYIISNEDEDVLEEVLAKYIVKRYSQVFETKPIFNPYILESDFKKVMIQFICLGYIEVLGDIWRLTKEGTKMLSSIAAIKK